MAAENASQASASESKFLNRSRLNETTIFEANEMSWTVVAAVSIATCIAGIITNGAVLLVILLHPHLRVRSFNVYVINLVVTNLLYFLIEAPLDIISQLYPHWWLGDWCCTVYIYTVNVFGVVLANGHALIALNRIWALSHPISYKNLHTVVFTRIVCLAVWVYAHLTTMPGLVQDALFYRRPPEIYGCYINPTPQFTWRVLTQFLLYNGPEYFVLASFPFIWYKQTRRNKIVPLRNKQIIAAEHDQTEKVTQTTGAVGKRNSSRASRSEWSHSSDGAFLVLTLLTVTVAICWTPIMTYYTVLMFTEIRLAVFLKIATVLFGLSPLLDPVYFSISLKELREAVKIDFLWSCAATK